MDYCIIVLLQEYCAAVLLCYCTTLLLCDRNDYWSAVWITVLLYYSMEYCTAVLPYYCATVPLGMGGVRGMGGGGMGSRGGMSSCDTILRYC